MSAAARAVGMSRAATGRVRLLIDTDAGTDDAQAIVTALRVPNASIEAITTVHGNCAEAQVRQNVAKLLRAMDSSVPVHRGAAYPLMSKGKPGPNALSWHGADGFGESALPDVAVAGGGGEQGGEDAGKAENTAAVVIARLAQQNPGEITLLALGPLTNIALALALEPRLPKLLKRVVFMGGDRNGVGNITPHAEFNAYGDPEALALCLGQFDECTCVDWTLTLESGFQFDWFRQTVRRDTPTARFLRDISMMTLEKSEDPSSEWNDRGYLVPDVLAACVALNPTAVEAEVEAVDAARVHVVLQGEKRGQTVLVHPAEAEAGCEAAAAAQTVRFVTKLHMDAVRELFSQSTEI